MIYAEDGEICIYPSQRILRLLGKEYTLLIIGLLGNVEEGIGFNEMARSIGRPRPSVLSARLKELEEAGLITRRVENTRPVAVNYALSEKGKELRRLLIPLFKWLEKNEEGTAERRARNRVDIDPL